MEVKWYINVSVNQAITGSDNGLSSDWCQVIIWTNVSILLIGYLGTNFNEIVIKIHTFSFKKCMWKCCLQNVCQFCLGPNVLSYDQEMHGGLEPSARFIMYAINISSSGICLGMRSANERHRYIVRTSLTGWAHSWTDYWSSRFMSLITAKFLFRLTQSLWNLTSLLATLLLRHLSNIKTIHQFRYPILHLQGFIWSCDKHHIVYWQDARGLFY